MTFNLLESTSNYKDQWPGTFPFQGQDSEKNLRKLSKKNPAEARLIDYTVNSCGYRCSEFEDINWSESIVACGCSNTFGIGVDDKETWSYQLSKKLDMPVINLGMGGTSIWYHVYNLKQIVKYNPKYVVIQVPHDSRFTLFRNNFLTRNIGSWSSGYEKYFHRIFNTDAENTRVYQEFALDYLDKMLPNGITFKFSHDTAVDTLKIPDIDKGRDQMHPGPLTHDLVATKIAEYFKSSVLK